MTTLPYYAVIFTSVRTDVEDGYQEMNELMMQKAKVYPGYLGFEAAREEIGIAVSYWQTLSDIKAWKEDVDHQMAQSRGRAEWYSSYRIRIARVERDYDFDQN